VKILFQDLRYAFRQLLKSPGFTLTAILSLSCGIAATAAVFSVVWGVIMNPYPYANPDRMVHLNLHGDRPGQDDGFGITGSQWQRLRQSPVVEDAIITDNWSLTVTGQDVPEDLQGAYFSSNAFQFFGVPTLLGRGLQPSDAVDGQDPAPVVVLGYKFWQRHYQGDRSVIGRTIELIRKPYTIVGVAPERFTWQDADVYVPLKVTQDPIPAYGKEVRLKPGVTPRMAEQVLQPLFTEFEKETPKHFPAKPGALHLQGLNERFLQEIGGSLALLFGAVALLLAVGCGNVSILLLARGASREHELAVRAAIGASRSRIVRQLLTESLLLSITGAALGVLVAYKLLSLIVTLLPQNSFPHEAAIGINLPVLIFSVLVALATGVFFGLFPALRLSRPDVREAMQAGTRKVTGTRSSRSLSSYLIAGQIALTLLMMASAGAAIQAFLKLANRPLGYDPHNVMSVEIPVHQGTYATYEGRVAYFEHLLQKVGQTQGVKLAAISSGSTPPNNGARLQMEILGKPSSAGQTIRANLISQDYFPVLGIPLVSGRLWSETENHNAAKVAVINQTLARKYFPDGDAIGHSIRLPAAIPQPPFVVTAPGADGWLQIIGITADKLDDGLDKPVFPELFIPYTLYQFMGTQVLVKTDGPPMALLHAIGLQVKSVDADQQIAAESTDLEHWISNQTEYQQGHFVSWLFGAFAALALILAAVGLYSVVSYTVAQRTNEFGIRMALGALRGDVLGLVFRATAVSVGIGVAAGVVLTFLLHKLLAQLASATAPGYLPLLLAISILAAVALIASAIPARRAASIEPMEALRYE
jgi:predicted permease